jgi:hypothetical protein
LIHHAIIFLPIIAEGIPTNNGRNKLYRNIGTPDKSPGTSGLEILKEHLPRVASWLETEFNFKFTLKEGSDCVYTSPRLYKDCSDPTKVLPSLDEKTGEFKLVCAHETRREKYLPFFVEALGLLKQLSFRLEGKGLFTLVNDLKSVYETTKESNEPILLESPTGASETQSAGDKALDTVLENPEIIAVLTFPSKRLAREVMRGRSDMIDIRSKGDPRALDVHVQLISHETNMTLEKLYVLFQIDLRPKIIITLHSYLRYRGRSDQLSLLAGFLSYNSHRIWLFVDELHRFIGDSFIGFPYVRVKASRKTKCKDVEDTFMVRSAREFMGKNISINTDLEPGTIYAELNLNYDAWTLSDKLSSNKAKYSFEINNGKPPTLLNMTSHIRQVIPSSNSETKDAAVDLLNFSSQGCKHLFDSIDAEVFDDETRNMGSLWHDKILDLTKIHQICNSSEIQCFINHPTGEFEAWLEKLTGAPDLQIDE